MIKHFVQYLHPGLIVSDTSTKEVPERSLDYVLPLGDHTFGFRFFDMHVMKDGDMELKSEPFNYSNYYYIGTKKTRAEIEERNSPKDKTLLTNMTISLCTAIVETKFGQSIPLRKDDVVLA